MAIALRFLGLQAGQQDLLAIWRSKTRQVSASRAAFATLATKLPRHRGSRSRRTVRTPVDSNEVGEQML